MPCQNSRTGLNWCSLCRQAALVLADQAVDDVRALDPAGYIDRMAGFVQRRSLVPRLVRPVFVVVPRVLGQDTLEVPFAMDQQVVQALASQRSREPLRKGIRFRRLDRRLDDPRAVAGEHVVECRGELRQARAIGWRRSRSPVRLSRLISGFGGVLDSQQRAIRSWSSGRDARRERRHSPAPTPIAAVRPASQRGG